MTNVVKTGEATEIYNALYGAASSAFQDWMTPVRPRIDIADDTSSRANGSQQISSSLRNEIERTNASVDLGRVHGYGMQSVHPTVSITWPSGLRVLYGPLRIERIEDIIDEALTGAGSHAKDLIIGRITGDDETIESIRSHPFFSCEPAERRLLANLGVTDPESIAHALATGSYRALARIKAVSYTHQTLPTSDLE